MGRQAKPELGGREVGRKQKVDGDVPRKAAAAASIRLMTNVSSGWSLLEGGAAASAQISYNVLSNWSRNWRF